MREMFVYPDKLDDHFRPKKTLEHSKSKVIVFFNRLGAKSRALIDHDDSTAACE